MLFRPYSDPSLDAFEKLWRSSPRRQGGKLAAEEEYRKALVRANAHEIQAGMEAYAAYVTAHGYEERYIVSPREFLRRGMWLDEYELPEVKRGQSFPDSCPHSPTCHSPVWCQVQRAKGEAV